MVESDRAPFPGLNMKNKSLILIALTIVIILVEKLNIGVIYKLSYHWNWIARDSSCSRKPHRLKDVTYIQIFLCPFTLIFSDVRMDSLSWSDGSSIICPPAKLIMVDPVLEWEHKMTHMSHRLTPTALKSVLLNGEPGRTRSFGKQVSVSHSFWMYLTSPRSTIVFSSW